jgi:hypothetical protein
MDVLLVFLFVDRRILIWIRKITDPGGLQAYGSGSGTWITCPSRLLPPSYTCAVQAPIPPTHYSDVSDPGSIRSVDPYPDPGGQK